MNQPTFKQTLKLTIVHQNAVSDILSVLLTIHQKCPMFNVQTCVGKNMLSYKLSLMRSFILVTMPSHPLGAL